MVPRHLISKARYLGRTRPRRLLGGSRVKRRGTKGVKVRGLQRAGRDMGKREAGTRRMGSKEAASMEPLPHRLRRGGDLERMVGARSFLIGFRE